MKKVCSKCGIEKDISEFYFRKEKNYYRKQCKQCCLKMDKEYRELNKEKISERVKIHSQKPETKEQRKEYRKDYKLKNCEKIKEQSKEYREKNKDYIKQWHKDYYKNNKEYLTEKSKTHSKDKENRKEYNKNYRKNKLNNDSEYKIKSYMLSHFTRELKKQNIKKTDKFFKYTGLKYSDYIDHFKKSELWFDYNNGESIHVDHIIPISVFDLNNKTDIFNCWQLENLRLLPSSENQSKNNKIDFELIEKHNIYHLLPEKLKNAI